MAQARFMLPICNGFARIMQEFNSSPRVTDVRRPLIQIKTQSLPLSYELQLSSELRVNRELKNLVLQLLNEHRIMTIATNRPDGWPQATMVGYVNDGFLLYCFVALNAQKYANILRDPRVSIAIGSDAPRPRDIKGLSLAARASPVTDQEEFDYISAFRLKHYPEYAASSPPDAADGAEQRVASKPSQNNVVLLRIVPEIISVLDYSKAFGHSDLIAFSERDLDMHLESLRHRWADTIGDDAEEPDENT